jgi:hypothetical protein
VGGGIGEFYSPSTIGRSAKLYELDYVGGQTLEIAAQIGKRLVAHTLGALIDGLFDVLAGGEREFGLALFQPLFDGLHLEAEHMRLSIVCNAFCSVS